MNLEASAAPKPLIAAKKLTIAVDGARLLDSIDLAIHAHEIVTLIGPNGSGKTTLVRALLGLVPLASGAVIRNSARLGYVPQNFARDRSLPLTALRFLRSFGAAGDAEAREALARVGASEVASRQLSS